MILLGQRFKDFFFLSKSFKALQDLLFNSSFLTQTFVPPGVWNPVEQRSGSHSKTLNNFTFESRAYTDETNESRFNKGDYSFKGESTEREDSH